MSSSEHTSGSTSADDAAAAAKEKAAQAKETARAGKDAAAAVATTATDQAKNVAQETSAQARDLLGKTKSELNDQVGTQKVAVVENLRSLGDQLAEMTDHVEHQGTAVDVASQARDRVRSAAEWLDGHEPGEVLDELRRVGRNRPGAFLLGSLVAGVVAGRLTRGVVDVHTDDSQTGEAAHRADDTDIRPRPAIGGYPSDSLVPGTPAGFGETTSYGPSGDGRAARR